MEKILPTQEAFKREANTLRRTATERYPNHTEIEVIIGLCIITEQGEKVVLYNVNAISTTVTTKF